MVSNGCKLLPHNDVIKWRHFPRYWPFVRGIHRSPVNSLHKGQWRGALMFSLIYVWINGWVNNCEAGDLRCYRAHYDIIVLGSGSGMVSNRCKPQPEPMMIQFTSVDSLIDSNGVCLLWDKHWVKKKRTSLNIENNFIYFFFIENIM